jgi:hypothetical protein
MDTTDKNEGIADPKSFAEKATGQDAPAEKTETVVEKTTETPDERVTEKVTQTPASDDSN